MILAIGRAERFSPNSVDNDAAILRSVCVRLRQQGHSVALVSESELTPDACADAYISMGRLESTLALLDSRQRDGAVVVNGAGGVALCCDRMSLVARFRSQGIPVPAESGPHGYWLKRAHGVAEGPMDVRFAANGCEAAMVKAEMQANGVAEVLQCAHVPGDLIKFYGVRGTAFFRHFYPGDDGITKFGDEQRNGRPCHYPFSVASLQAIAERAAGVAGVDVYGGDCIVGHDGSICIIDFNDWPSFARCREEAAEAIAATVAGRMACLQMEKREIC